jgi:hypothetical protein
LAHIPHLFCGEHAQNIASGTGELHEHHLPFGVGPEKEPGKFPAGPVKLAYEGYPKEGPLKTVEDGTS